MITNKLIRAIKYLKLSTILSILIYIVFIGLILFISFGFNNNLITNNKNDNNKFNKLNNFHNDNDLIKLKSKLKLINKNKNVNHNIKTVILSNSLNENDLLKQAFASANLNNDNYLSIQELGKYISKKINEHISNSIRNNPILFSKIDLSPKDGLITWDEYHKFFLREHGLDETYVREHSENKHLKLNRKAKEDMMRDKARWSEAAKTDPFSLTLDEFLAFRHPESSVVNLLSLVDDLLRMFDLDGDDRLTIEEFADLSIEDIDETYQKKIVSKTVEERRAEFKRIIDRDHDGKATREELLRYVDPKHPRYAIQEAVTLFNLTDTNKDGQLDINEILNSPKIFMSSKVIDAATSFHDEF